MPGERQAVIDAVEPARETRRMLRHCIHTKARSVVLTVLAPIQEVRLVWRIAEILEFFRLLFMYGRMEFFVGGYLLFARPMLR